ncbi:helix-turn-helix domain-containing protein [Vaginisenegalia massiliensis]|uniref:helix-turn-helix domain-containing protein n=1 Tax=Vaginisenegalia massiliensis TaxID=2058294 RepID=UPI000F522851|nr:helix-turn-helix transcriptional regulator [Vaginisenegalia massiliensis]
MENNQLFELVNRSGKTVHQIQIEAGISSGTLYRLLSGKRKKIYLDAGIRLADALNVDVKELGRCFDD